MITRTASKIRSGLLKRIHVDQHAIKRSIHGDADEPAITVQTSTGPYKAHEVDIMYGERVIATFKSRPHDPLSCGARLWIETTEEVRTRIR